MSAPSSNIADWHPGVRFVTSWIAEGAELVVFRGKGTTCPIV